jgi:hypothetical protein
MSNAVDTARPAPHVAAEHAAGKKVVADGRVTSAGASSVNTPPRAVTPEPRKPAATKAPDPQQVAKRAVHAFQALERADHDFLNFYNGATQAEIDAIAHAWGLAYTGAGHALNEVIRAVHSLQSGTQDVREAVEGISDDSPNMTVKRVEQMAQRNCAQWVALDEAAQASRNPDLQKETVFWLKQAQNNLEKVAGLSLQRDAAAEQAAREVDKAAGAVKDAFAELNTAEYAFAKLNRADKNSKTANVNEIVEASSCVEKAMGQANRALDDYIEAKHTAENVGGLNEKNAKLNLRHWKEFDQAAHDSALKHRTAAGLRAAKAELDFLSRK